MSDYPDWLEPNAVAAAIATGNPGGTPGGVPLLHANTQIVSTTLSNILAGTNQNTGFFNTTQIGYECQFNIANNASLVALSFVKITFDWRDANSGIILLTEDWVVCSGPAGTSHSLTGRGPSAANQCRVTVTNDAASADAVNVDVRVFASSRIFTRSDMRTSAFQSASFTKAGQDVSGDIIGASSPGALGSGGVWTRLLPLYAGQANFFGLTSSGLADGEFAVTGIGSVFGMASNNFVYDNFTNAKGSLFQAMALPRYQCVATGTNHNAASFSLSFTMTLLETET